MSRLRSRASVGALWWVWLAAVALQPQPAATAAKAAPAESSFRLPKTVRPIEYDLYIETFLGDDDQGFMFRGHVIIMLSSTSPVDEIRLHAKDLEIDWDKVQLTSHARPVPKVVSLRTDAEQDLLILKLDGPLQEGAAYKLRLEFSAPLGEGLAGYYRSSYRDRASGETRWLSVTQFEAMDARRAFPCFDEPSFKANFSLSLAHHKKYTSISNMPQIISQPLVGRNDWVLDYFEPSWRMSTYLVAFVVSDLGYVVSATPDNSTLFRVWARKDALMQTGYASEVGPRMLTFYERFFQVPYPLPKQDMVAIPDFAAGAMENWGLITYRERVLLFHHKESSPLEKRDVASVVAHELAHQWFGNLVTMRWWSDLWLNEGFATYVATLGVHAVHPHWKSLEADALTNMQTVLKFDALETSHPLSVKLDNPSEISQIFDAISYKKGSFLIRMMSHFLGEPVFRDGLTNYLRDHSMDNAEQDDLWNALTEEAHLRSVLPRSMSVKTVMDTWTLQTGYPVLTLSRDPNKTGSVSISQSKYLSYESSDPRRANGSSCWEVPLTYTTAKQPRRMQRTWLHCREGRPANLTLELDAGERDWLLLNVNATGLYRVLYDSHSWELLGAALQGEPAGWPLDRLSRAQLVEDSLALAWSGDLPYGRALRHLTYLRREPDYLPWKAALTSLSGLYHLLRRSAGYGLFREFVLGLMKKSLQQWGNLQRPMPNDDLEAFRQRRLITSWACRLAEPTCVRQAAHYFQRWMREANPDRNNPVPRGLRYEVMCTALRHSGVRHWDFVWQRYLASNIASERTDMLKALGCAREPWLLQRLLEWSIQEGEGIRRQDSATVFNSVAFNEYGFHIAKDFLIRNITQLHQFYSLKKSRLSKYIKAVTEDMYTQRDIEEFDNFAKRNADYLKQSTLAVRQARDKISVNVAWYQTHHEELVRELKQLVPAPAPQESHKHTSSGNSNSSVAGR